ncbi:single-stranded DNA-binding protein [Candidatus Peregrinibacteria bacterium]|nr:single-stranded DNA-binding protein [Candidatus Peregrinibacteria bacterium]
MRSVNKVILVGNLTRDPDMRQTVNGQSIVTFGLATNREWMTKDGRKQQSVEFHELAAWAKIGEICQQYLKKGKLVYIEGYLKTRMKLLPDGTKKFRTEIVVQDMIMLDKRTKGEEEDQKIIEAAPESQTNQTSGTEEAPAAVPEGDDVFEG